MADYATVQCPTSVWRLSFWPRQLTTRDRHLHQARHGLLAR